LLATTAAIGFLALAWRRRTTAKHGNGSKKRFITNVLGCHDEYLSPDARVFRYHFQTVFRFKQAANASFRGSLLCALQAMEAWFVIGQVAPRLAWRTPIVTLHDAICHRASDAPVVRAAFEEAFEEWGFRLALKQEAWASRTTMAS
jgi:hypothetical protein